MADSLRASGTLSQEPHRVTITKSIFVVALIPGGVLFGYYLRDRARMCVIKQKT